MDRFESVHPVQTNVGFTALNRTDPSKTADHSANNRPLFLHLHGFGQNRTEFLRITEKIARLEGIHVYPDGIYPIPTRTHRTLDELPRTWYIYDGNPDRFTEALESASTFLDSLLDHLVEEWNPSDIMLQGYSMGGYLAGYYSLTRPGRIRAVVATGCRIKTEVVHHWTQDHKRLSILAVHGRKDDRVDGKRQLESISILRNREVNAEMMWTEGGHEMDLEVIDSIYNWLLRKTQ